MTAEKGNKVYDIDVGSKERYQAEGYDIRDDNGKIVAYATGKTVPYDEYERLKAELEALKAQTVNCEEKSESEKTQKVAVKKTASK